MTNTTQKKLNPSGFIAALTTMKTNGLRGPLSDIERSRSETQRYRAYEYVARYCDLENLQHTTVMCMIGSLFVKFKCRTGPKENFGAAMLKLAQHHNSSAKAIDRRMRKLITNSTGIDACNDIVYILDIMHSHSIPVDFVSLINDLVFWNEKIIRSWASAYYTNRHT